MCYKVLDVKKYQSNYESKIIERKKVCWSLSHVRLFATPCAVAHQASLSMEFSRQEYWSGLPFLSPGDLPDPGIKTGCPALQADSSLSEPPGKPSLFWTPSDFKSIPLNTALSSLEQGQHFLGRHSSECEQEDLKQLQVPLLQTS